MPWYNCTQRAKIAKKVHKPPLKSLHRVACFFLMVTYFPGVKKGEHVENTKSLLYPEVFFLIIHDLPFSPGHLLESKGRFVNLSVDFSPFCGSEKNRPLYVAISGEVYESFWQF